MRIHQPHADRRGSPARIGSRHGLARRARMGARVGPRRGRRPGRSTPRGVAALHAVHVARPDDDLDSSGRTTNGAAWLHTSWMLAPGLVVSPGARVDRWGMLDTTSVSPWLLAEWQIAPALRWRGGGGAAASIAAVEQAQLARTGMSWPPSAPVRGTLASSERLAACGGRMSARLRSPGVRSAAVGRR